GHPRVSGLPGHRRSAGLALGAGHSGGLRRLQHHSHYPAARGHSRKAGGLLVFHFHWKLVVVAAVHSRSNACSRSLRSKLLTAKIAKDSAKFAEKCRRKEYRSNDNILCSRRASASIPTGGAAL